MYVYLCQMSWYVLLYFVVFDLVSIWYLFSLFLTLYSMYLCILYMSPLYINMFLYFSISLFYLSYFTLLYCVCPPFLKTVFFLSFFLESRVMLCMYTLYFKRCTLYKCIEINSVLFLKRYAVYIINQVYFVLIDRTFVSNIFNNSISEKRIQTDLEVIVLAHWMSSSPVITSRLSFSYISDTCYP